MKREGRGILNDEMNKILAIMLLPGPGGGGEGERFEFII